MPQESTRNFLISERESELRSAFLDQVNIISEGYKIKQCIQCGSCTGSCPVSYAMDYTPRHAIALFRAGEIESILKSNTMWICASCYACTVRCPAGIKITDIMYALKRIAMNYKIYPKHFAIHALSSSFINIVNKYGRNQEFKLLFHYGIKTNLLKLLPSLPLGWKLKSKGRIQLTSKKIKGWKQLSDIIKRITNNRKSVMPSVAD